MSIRWRSVAIAGLVVAGTLGWLGAVPWAAYAACGTSTPASLPASVRVGLYEEFPTPDRLDKLRYLDRPVSLAVAATSRAEFLRYRDAVQPAYPMVDEVFFWPLLPRAEGYYPGTWSAAAAVRRVAHDADGLPVVWDMELPRDLGSASAGDWGQNREFLDQWLRRRTEPTHMWRSMTALGLDPPLLRAAALHFDPRDYPRLSLQLDLYATGSGLPDPLLRRVLRCGVERYGDRFVPTFGVLDDGQGPAGVFVPAGTLRRYLVAARDAGVGEVWLFGVNGLNDGVVATLRAVLPARAER